MPSTGAVSSSDGSQRNSRHRRRGRRGLAGDRRHAAVAGEHARAGMVEDEGDVVRLQHEVDRNHHGAEAHERVAQRDEAVGVAREHGDPVAAPDPAAREPRREPLADGVEFARAPARRPAGEAEPVGNALALRRKRVGERLPPEAGSMAPP